MRAVLTCTHTPARPASAALDQVYITFFHLKWPQEVKDLMNVLRFLNINLDLFQARTRRVRVRPPSRLTPRPRSLSAPCHSPWSSPSPCCKSARFFWSLFCTSCPSNTVLRSRGAAHTR